MESSERTAKYPGDFRKRILSERGRMGGGK